MSTKKKVALIVGGVAAGIGAVATVVGCAKCKKKKRRTIEIL